MQPHIPTTEFHWTNLRHFRIFRNTVDLFGTAQNYLTNQTTTFGIKHIRNSNRTPVLNIQWFGNSKTIMFYLKHKARPCSGSTGSLKSFFYLLRCVPKSANKTSNCLTDILKTYKSGRDTASTWIKTMKFSLLLLSHENRMYPESHVLTGPANHVLMSTSFFFSQCVFWGQISCKNATHTVCTYSTRQVRMRKICKFVYFFHYAFGMWGHWRPQGSVMKKK